MRFNLNDSITEFIYFDICGGDAVDLAEEVYHYVFVILVLVSHRGVVSSLNSFKCKSYISEPYFMQNSIIRLPCTQLKL